MDQNTREMNEVLQALRDLGLGEDDLATSLIELNPRYSNDGTAIVGYDAANQVEVTVRDLALVGRVLDTGVDHGANVAGGIRFRLSDGNAGEERALADAVTDARAKAETMATAADAGIGEPLTIVESSGGGQPGPYYAEAVSYAAADMAVPVETPTIETEVAVTVTWRLT
jgi:hypothetical protein